ncbi:MAG TPA: tetratricopeptide repeat protein [Candidatus Atribacteria bacterium]|nr:tetratricopeptide repeat protein [Candidatus Atribacteria bacterium]
MTEITNNYLKNGFLKEKYPLKRHFYIIIVFAIMISFFYNLQIVQASERKVSILYFNNHTEQTSWDWLSTGLTTMLIDDLSRSDTLVCSSRQEIEDLYYNYELLPISAEIEKSLLVQFNQNLDAEVIFFGDFYLSPPSNLNLSLKKYDNSTGEITAFRDIIVGVTDIANLKDKLIQFILKELDVEISLQEKTELPEMPTTSLDALSNYNKSLDLMNKAIAEYGGIDYPSKKLWAEAIEYGEKAITADPKFAEAYYLLAEIYNRTHWTIREVNSLNSFIQLVEDNQLKSKDIYKKAAQAYFRLGYSFYSKGEQEQAIKYFISSTKYDPDLLEPRLHLVQIYFDKGEIGLSLDQCEEVLRIDPQNKEISWFIKKNEQSKKYGRSAYENYEKGYLSYKNGNFKEAITYFKSSIFANPDFKEPHYYLALSYYEIGDLDNSIFQWEEVIRIDSFDNTARHFLNNCLEEKKYGVDTLKYFNAGYDYYIKGEYDKAIEEFNRSLDYNPEFEKARQFLSRAYYQLNQMEEYREERKKTTELKVIGEEEKAMEYYKLGYEFYSLKDYKVALEEIKKALDIKSDYPQARYLLAECYFQLKEYRSAQVEYERVVTDSEMNEYTDDALYGSGWSYYLLEEYEAAAKRFSKLLNDFPDSNLALQARHKLGKSYFLTNNYEGTIKVYREFLEKYIEYKGQETAEVYYLLAQAFFRSGKYKEAEEFFDKLLFLFPTFELASEVKYYSALSLFKENKYEAAKVQLEGLIAEMKIDDKRKREAQYLLARCRLNLKEYPQTIENLESLKQLVIDDSLLEKVSFDLALTYSRQGNKEKSIVEFQEFIEKYPKSELINSVHFELGKNLYDLKKYKLALSELEKASHDEALYLRGKASQELGDQEGEIIAFEELIKKYPESIFSQEAYFRLGNYYYNQKRDKEAIEEFRKIIQFFPQSPLLSECYYWIGWSYFKLLDYKQAIEYFNQVEEDEENLYLAQRAKFMVAESWYNLEDYQKAREAYQKYIEMYPKGDFSVNAQYAIAWTYLENKDYSLSTEEFKKLMNLYPESKFIEEAQFRVGKNYYLSGDKTMAKTELGKFINSFANSSFRIEAMYLLSQIYLQEEDWMDSIINLNRLVREYPDNLFLSEALYGLCLSYFKKDEYEKAIQTGEQYLKDYPSLEYSDDILYIKAICWEKLENQEKAIYDYKNLISTYPQSPYAGKSQERVEVLQKINE